MKNIIFPFDSIGIIASSLCMIHCLVTPILFIASSCTAICCSETPFWWQIIDYIFLTISFIVIFNLSYSITKKWLILCFWGSWFLLLTMILNHSFNIINLNSIFIYIPALIIILLHFYNMQYCKCEDKTCCQKA